MEAVPAELDELDHTLIAALRLEGRVANRALAERIGVSEATIGSRIRRLADERILRVVAVTDMAAMGYGVLVGGWIQVRGRSPVQVAEELARTAEVASITLLLGTHDLFATVLARDHDHLADLVGNVQRVAGITNVDWELALRVWVYRSEWGILSQDGHPPMPQPGPGIDELDVEVIRLLQRDGRVSNRRLATELKVSEATIRARIRRLELGGAIRISAVTDVGRLGIAGFAIVGVEVVPGRADDVAKRLAAIPELAFVATVLGRHDVLTAVVVRDRESLLDLVLEQIPQIPGVRRTDTAEAQLVLKHSFGWVRLEAAPALPLRLAASRS